MENNNNNISNNDNYHHDVGLFFIDAVKVRMKEKKKRRHELKNEQIKIEQHIFST